MYAGPKPFRALTKNMNKFPYNFKLPYHSLIWSGNITAAIHQFLVTEDWFSFTELAAYLNIYGEVKLIFATKNCDSNSNSLEIRIPEQWLTY